MQGLRKRFTLRDGLIDLSWVGCCVRLLGDQFTVLKPGDHLSLHDTALFQPFGRVLADDILFLGDELPDRIE